MCISEFIYPMTNVDMQIRICFMKRLKITKRYKPESVNQRTENTMAKGTNNDLQNIHIKVLRKGKQFLLHW